MVMLMYRNEMCVGQMMSLLPALYRQPHAVARIEGSSEYPEIRGKVHFYQTNIGVLVMAEVFGLPTAGRCLGGIFGFHIHEGRICAGNEGDAFEKAMMHYNPEGCMHPYHAGDLPPLFGNNGYAFHVFLTDNFFVDEVIGRTIIIHANPDDFTTQPAGNSGTKMACGKIVKRCPTR